MYVCVCVGVVVFLYLCALCVDGNRQTCGMLSLAYNSCLSRKVLSLSLSINSLLTLSEH